MGETGWTLKKRIVEHKAAVKKEDNKNGIAVHVKNTKHHIDWDGARVISNEMQYCTFKPPLACVLYFYRVVCVFMFIVMFYCSWAFYLYIYL